MKISLKNFIVPSIPLAVLLVLFCMSLWLTDFGAGAVLISMQGTHTDFISSFIANPFVTIATGIILTLLNSFLIAQINNRFTIIRIRTFLPIFIFLLLTGTWYTTHFQITSQLALTLFILAVFNFFSMLRENKASEQAFLGSFLISLSSLLINQYIFLIPVCWIGFIIFRSLSLRTFLASLMGTLAPWILYLSVLYLFNPTFSLNNFQFENSAFNMDFTAYSLVQYIYAGLLTIILIISTFGLSMMSRSDAIHTRNKLNFLLFLLVSLAILSVIFATQVVIFLPLIAFIYALLLSHPLTLNQNNFYAILFYVFCLVNLAFTIFKFIHF